MEEKVGREGETACCSFSPSLLRLSPVFPRTKLLQSTERTQKGGEMSIYLLIHPFICVWYLCVLEDANERGK